MLLLNTLLLKDWGGGLEASFEKKELQFKRRPAYNKLSLLFKCGYLEPVLMESNLCTSICLLFMRLKHVASVVGKDSLWRFLLDEVFFTHYLISDSSFIVYHSSSQFHWLHTTYQLKSWPEHGVSFKDLVVQDFEIILSRNCLTWCFIIQVCACNLNIFFFFEM